MPHKAAPGSVFRPTVIVLAVLALAACEVAAPPPATAVTPTKTLAATAPAAEPLGEPKRFNATTASYRCANGERLLVSYRTQDAALITYRGQTHFLPLARSASGARYGGDGWQWWIKGDAEGTLSRLPSNVAVAPGPGVICKEEIAPPQDTHVRTAAKPDL